GPAARLASDQTSGYFIAIFPGVGVCQFHKISGGSAPQVGTNLPFTGGTIAPGDVFRLEVSGSSTTLPNCHQNGDSPGTFSDSSTPITAAGTAGLFVSMTSATNKRVINTVWAGAIGGPGAVSVSPSSVNLAHGATREFDGAGGLTGETFTWAAGTGSVDSG